VQGQGRARKQDEVERKQGEQGHEVSSVGGAQNRTSFPIVRYVPAPIVQRRGLQLDLRSGGG
jgi:hypothetical protein